jgi:predicted SnoaL-like aldol condensation-catalyzing enzyme
MREKLERNKKNVMASYDLMFNQNNPTEAIKRYVEEFTSSTTQWWLKARKLH